MKSKFIRGYVIYVIILVIISVMISCSMHRHMINFEKYDPENYIKNYLSNQIDEDTVKQLFQSNSQYENENELFQNVREFFNHESYTIKRKDKNIYDIEVDGDTLMTLYFDTLKSVNLLGLLNYDVIELVKIEGTTDRELLHYEIIASSAEEIKVNGVVAKPDKVVKNDEFSDASKYVEIPSMNTYVLRNMTKFPRIEYGNQVISPSTLEEGNVIKVQGEKSYQSLEEAGIDFDLIKFAEDWSLFLTNDLQGGTRGFSAISRYFIKDSNMYKKAKSWATSIDITFTSKHRLNNPPFPKEEVSNVVVYSENAFKANVKVDKSMTILGKQITQKIDTFNSTIYVVKTKDGYKVTNIKGVIE